MVHAVSGSVSGGLAFLERSAAAWIQGVAGLTDADPVVANRELIAAGAEIALLRDLHRAGRPRPG